ncbi:TPA: tRNA (adenosine(37)-N6)-threonylcarbamoyltransferase complex ATPase subunit type 1 TsaE [Candidatus Avacholeplasma faecigallinarum]|nr:tRNA (adenosine(37)-N6)-threonylcarbamoyltransferase complex ATPase subunit type 1 TsaE [Candidatus Avacholeplasma faecigallinarum]
MKTFITKNQEETIAVGEKLGKLLKPGDVVLLTGDLSAGKTTFTKGIGKAIGVKKIINSPTFTIVKEYRGDEFTLYHLDLYRLDGLNQDFDLEEYIQSDGICVIEWPYQVKELIPDEYIKVSLKLTGESNRSIEITFVGDHYKDLEEVLK